MSISSLRLRLIQSIKSKFDKIAPILQTIHTSAKELRGEFVLLLKIKNYTNLRLKKFFLMPNESVIEMQSSLDRKVADLVVLTETLVISIWCLKTISNHQGRDYLFDWEYSSMNDPQCDLAVLFLVSLNSLPKIVTLSSHYESVTKPVFLMKIAIYKILQDTIFGVYGLYKGKSKVQILVTMVNLVQRAL